MKEAWEVEPFWLILIKDGHTHAQPFNFSMYGCASESWIWISNTLLQQKWPTTFLAVSAREDTGGQGKKSLVSTCKTTSSALWGGLEGHLHDLKPFILHGAQNLTEQNPEEAALPGSTLSIWLEPPNVSHNLSYFIDTWLHIISSKPSRLWNLACEGIKSLFLT